MFRRRGSAANSGTLDWAACPSPTHVGVPVHGYLLPRTLALANDSVRRAFHEHPGRLFVACGLALQAVQRALVTTNLLPDRDVGVLRQLRASLRARPAATGWGLDVSVSGLKAVRIEAGPDGSPAITRALCMAHRLPLNHPEAASSRPALLRETLARFGADHHVAAADRVVVSWPAPHSFVRFLHLPPAEGRKRRDMLELETRRQIPMPLDLVARDTFAFPHSSGTAPFEPVPILLLAARLKDVEEHRAVFAEAEMDVHAVQCDAVAWHNFLHFDQLADSPDRTSDAEPAGIAALDVGAETTNVVFSTRDSLWFRSRASGG